MKRSGGRSALVDLVALFQAEIQQLALTAVRGVIDDELRRRRATIERARPRKVRDAKPAQRQLEMRLAQPDDRQLELPLSGNSAHGATAPASPDEPQLERTATSAAEGASVTAMRDQPANILAGDRRGQRWTRGGIVAELASWLLSGTAIDAQFIARHGPRGLAAAARRVFGRFDAALNVAALHNAKLYPDGPPVRGRPAPSTAASEHEPT